MQLIRSVWRGEVRLWATYWLWGVAGNMTFVRMAGEAAALAAW